MATKNCYNTLKALLVLIGISGNVLFAQEVVPTKGKEFWVGFMESYEYVAWNSSLDLFVTSDQDTEGTVSIPLNGWSVDFTVSAYQTTTITVPMALAKHLTSEVIEQKGVYVETQDTVSVQIGPEVTELYGSSIRKVDCGISVAYNHYMAL